MAANKIRGAEYLVAKLGPEDIFTMEDFSDEQKQIAETTRELTENEILPRLKEIDEQNFELVQELMLKCGEVGLLMTDAPEEFGGLALDKTTSMAIAENIAPAGSFSVSFAAHTGIGTLPLIYYGTKAQKEQYLEKLITGEWISAYCLTEPEAGSDAMGGTAYATLSEDKKHYILNANKQFITNGGFAKLLVVFVKIDKEHFTAFLVESDTEGIEIGPEEKKLGIKGSSTTPINFTDVKVPVENLLGKIGKGHKIAFNILNVGRLKLAASVGGAGIAALNEAIVYANQRKQFGHPISFFGAIQEKIADAVTKLYCSQALVYRTAGHIDQALVGLDKAQEDYYVHYQKVVEDFSTECAIAKVYCSDVLAEVVDEVVQIFGGYGFIQEYPAERFYRDERINRIFEGTNEINRLLTSATILKKAMKGELPLEKSAMAAFEGLMSPSFDEPPTEPFGKELKLIENMKQIYLILTGAAVRKHQKALANEQEMLMAAADIAIEIYAAESGLLRAMKHYGEASDEKKALLEAVAKVLCFNANERLTSAARRGAFYIEEGDTLNMILSGIRRYTKFDASGLLEAKRLLAAKAIEQERYIF